MSEKSRLKRIDQDLSSSDEDTRWQAAIALGEYCESESDAKLIWPLMVKWGSHENEDIRVAIATCVLEHVLQYHFDTYFEKCAEIIRGGNLMFGFTFSMCGKFGQVRSPANSKKMDNLNKEYDKIRNLQSLRRKNL